MFHFISQKTIVPLHFAILNNNSALIIHNKSISFENNIVRFRVPCIHNIDGNNLKLFLPKCCRYGGRPFEWGIRQPIFSFENFPKPPHPGVENNFLKFVVIGVAVGFGFLSKLLTVAIHSKKVVCLILYKTEIVSLNFSCLLN